MKHLNHKLIHEFLEQSAEAYPDKIALIHEDTRATYSEINSKANQLAQWLMNQGVKKGDRVVIILENSLEYVVSYYGILKTGAVVVPLGTDLKPDGLNPLLAELEPFAIISNHRFDRLLKASDQVLINKTKLINLSTNPINPINQTNSINSINSTNPTSLSSIIYTSGSIGKPKGVMLSHKNIVSNVHAICQSLNIVSTDIQMVVLPFFYVMGKSLLNTHFAAGASIVINNKFAYPAAVLKQMIEEKITSFSGVPSTYAYLLHRSPLIKYREKLGILRYCSQAGGHMSRQIKAELREALPKHTDIFIMYGTTEASARLTYLASEKFENNIDSIGKAIPGVTLKILDEKGNEMPLGQKGEIVASGPNIMQGYWNDKEATNKVLGHHGYITGDLGYQDKEGYFYIIGRKDNLLKVGGHRINPQEIEDVLMETGLLTEAIIIGFPDELMGQKLMALATPKNNEISENLCLRECALRLPKYKVPSHLEFVKSLPKNSHGKIDSGKCMEIMARAFNSLK